MPIILSDAHAQKYAKSIVQFLVTQFGLKATVTSAPPVQEVAPDAEDTAPETQAPTVDNNNIRYKVQCGSFKSQDNAIKLKEKLKADGYDATVVKVDIR